MNGEINTVRWVLGMVVFTMAVGCEAEPYGTGPLVYDDPIAHPDDGFIFSSERINRIDLEIGDDALEILASQRLLSYPRDKVRAEGMIDGEPLAEVGVRLRGGLGSFTPFDTKPKLEIDLNLFSGDRFHGLESLSLNSMSEDCSGLVEAVGFAAYGKMGIPTSRTSYAAQLERILRGLGVAVGYLLWLLGIHHDPCYGLASEFMLRLSSICGQSVLKKFVQSLDSNTIGQ